MQVERPLLDRDKDRKVTIENMIAYHKYSLTAVVFLYFSFRDAYLKKSRLESACLIVGTAFYCWTN